VGTGKIQIEESRELVDIKIALKQYRKHLDKKTKQIML